MAEDWASALRGALFGRKQAEVTKDFWLSDSSCTVCYDCDQPFSLLVRRHHCRVCGRIFCSRCTAKSLPAATPGGDAIRVCNFCYQVRTSARRLAVQAEDSPRTDAGAAEAAAAATPPPDAHAGKAGLLRRGSQNASAALAALRDPLGHTWLGGAGGAPATPHTPATTQSAASDAALGSCKPPRETFERVRALASVTLPPEPDDESDDDLQAAVEQGAAARQATLARLLDSDSDMAPEEAAAGASSAGARSSGAGRGAAADADLLAAASESGDASLSDHPLASPAELQAADEQQQQQQMQQQSDVAAALAGPWAEEQEGAAADTDAPEDAAEPPAGDANLLASLEQAAAWAAPPAAPRDAAAATAACRAALRDAAAHHLRRVLAQVLSSAGIPHAAEWVPILAELAAAAAAAVQPAAGGAGYSMDPRDYLCVKRVPGGQRSDSRLVCGVACRRNVAHRRMAGHVESPRLLLLAGALQYQRVEGRLSSLDTLLEQERAHLRVACARAAALRPHVLLVEKSCARYAQELLLQHGISLVLNVKPAVLRRLARATGAVVAPSADQLRDCHVGTCGAFRVEALAEEHAPPPAAAAPPRTLMVFDGCPRPLCATVLLAGAPPEELVRVKALTPWAVYAAHHLRLEAAFLADELAAAGTQPAAAAAAVAAAVAAAAAALQVPPFAKGALASLSPHTALVPLPPGAAASGDCAAAAAWAATAVRAEERLLVSLSCRCPARRALCEPHNVRAIQHYCGTDVPLGHFLAAALPGPGRRCACGLGPEAHVRSYAAASGQLTLHVRAAGVAAPADASGGAAAAARCVWHWSRCAACGAQGAPPQRVLLSEASVQLSLGKFLALSLAALQLRGACGHSLHAQALRFFATPAGTACVAYAPLARLSVCLPPRALLPVRACTVAWVAAELREVAASAAADQAELAASLRASYASHVAAAGAPSPQLAREPPVLLAELERVAEEEARALAARLADAEANAEEGRPDVFAANRLRRALASAHRKWAAVLAELASSAWRSSFPVDARRGWADTSADGTPLSSSAAPAVQLLLLPPPGAASTLPAAPSAAVSAAHSRTPSDRAAAVLPGRALLPLGCGGATVVVYDDEPTSVVAYALASQQYAAALAPARASAAAAPPVAPAPTEPRAAAALAAAGVRWEVVASPAAAHVRCGFEDRGDAAGSGGGGGSGGGARFGVTAYYAPQFEALRALWGVTPASLLRSLCRCARWDSSGGKSGAYFAKTRDDRLVVKALSRPELASLLEFAPAYAAYAAAAATEARPVLLARLVGVFSVHVAAPGRRELKLDCVIMENVFAGGGYSPVFDLKGAVGRSRAAPGDAPVQLDENLLERVAGADAPLCVTPAHAALVSAAVWRDTAFLARLGVMDYSLLAGMQPQRKRLACGIVDYLRQYTWDKQLETYVKSSSAVLALSGGGAAAQPTVISPKQYARRFRRAMRSYFVVVPDMGDAAAGAQSDGSAAAARES